MPEQTDEEYVRAAWLQFRYEEDYGHHIWLGIHYIFESTKEAVYAAARAYTEEVLRKVAEIDAAIAWICADIDEQTQDCGVEGCGCDKPAKFILALLQRERESTARGLKQQ
jgi:hypothetical protein